MLERIEICLISDLVIFIIIVLVFNEDIIHHSLKLAMDIARVFEKPIEEIFSFEPDSEDKK